MKRVLVVDTDQGSCTLVRESLRAGGYEVHEVKEGPEALRALCTDLDAVVVCKPLTTLSAPSFLSEVRAACPNARVLLVAASSAEMVGALRQGAYYVTRSTLNPDEICLLLGRAFAENGLNGSVSANRESGLVFVGENPAIRAVREAVRRLGRDPLLPVLVTGESGTGKRTLVRLLHEQEGAARPFVSISPSEALEEAFDAAFDSAKGGTLFLTEVALTPIPFQVKLLEALRRRDAERAGSNGNGERPTRITAASSKDLQDAARDGEVLPELASRVGVARLDLPPLRERLSDIPLLVEHFTRKLAATGRCPKLRGVTEAAMASLMKGAWAGNVRELANVLEGAALLSDAEVLDVAQLSSLASAEAEPKYTLPSKGIDFRELEREVLVQALRKTGGNQTRAALLLGLTRDQIRYRMAKFGMTSRDSRQDDHAA